MTRRFYMRRRPKVVRGTRKFANAFKNPKHVLVEIGSFGGEFAAMMSPHFKQVHSIDPWDFHGHNLLLEGMDPTELRRMLVANPEWEEATSTELKGETVEGWFDENTAECTNVYKHKGYDYEFLSAFPDNSIDVLYIDSTHTFAAAGMTALRWFSRIKSGGVLAGHDNSKAYPQLQRLVGVLGEMLNQEPRTFEDASWAFRVP